MRAGLAAALVLGFVAAAAEGQVPRNVSPRLARAWSRPDTSVVVWVIAERSADLDTLAARVRRAGGTVRHQSRFVWAVSASVPGAALPTLAALPGVRRVQLVATYVRPRDETRGRRGAPAYEAPPACAVPPCVRASVRSSVLDTTYGPGA